MRPISSMISYSWNDSAAAELIHEELALRGFDVIHDRCTFALGTRIPQNIADAVSTCDAFVAYLTPSSLYLGAAPGTPRPAIDQEFLPMMKRWREATASERRGGPPAPVLVAPTHGLGDPRSEAPTAVFEATGESIGSVWAPVVLDQTTARITQEEAADLAQAVVHRVLASRLARTSYDYLTMTVTTRGQGQQPDYLGIDATSLLGGPNSRAGSATDWDRFLAGLRDVESALARGTRMRSLNIRPKAHLTACLATGRVFNQAAGWTLAVAGRHGDASLRNPGTASDLSVDVDRIGGLGAMTVEIDLLHTNLRELATEAIRRNGQEPRARVQIRRLGGDDLEPAEVSASALACTNAIRDAVAEFKPGLVRLFCASPAEFAVLVGHRLTSLHCDIQLHERDSDRYVESLLVHRSVP